MLKVARKAFNMGEVWNPVCCHGNRTVKLILWSTFSRILMPRVKHFWYKLAEMSPHHIWTKSGWVCDLANLHILKIWISLERKEIFENGKQHFFLMQSTCLCFKMAWIGKMRFSSQYHFKKSCVFHYLIGTKPQLHCHFMLNFLALVH